MIKQVDVICSNRREWNDYISMCFMSNEQVQYMVNKLKGEIMFESKVDWSKCPDAEFFAYGEFRKVGANDYMSLYWQVDHGCIDEGYWERGAFTLDECKVASDYEERPPQYDQSQDEKWDNGELGQDEEHVRVAPLTEKEFNQATAKTSIDFLNIVKDIQVERGAEYEQNGGERSFAKIAEVFNVYRGKDLLPSDIALILEIMKNVRFYAQDRYHSDSVIDKVSYASLWAELVTQERA